MTTFFVSCAMGFEEKLTTEIEQFWHQLLDLDGLPTRSRPEFVDSISGGVEIKCDLHLGYQINLFSKLANRVLLRFHSFEARYFDQFEKELKKTDLKSFFSDKKFNVFVSSSKSRLFHEQNLKECIAKVWHKAVVSQIQDEESSSKSSEEEDELSIENSDVQYNLFIRLFRDRVTLSIDTSGFHLHKRGYRLAQGAAPIRETLAAYMLQTFITEINFTKLNQSSAVLLDPFCGSGTLLFEYLLYGLPLFLKKMAFETFEKTPVFFKSEVWRKNYKIQSLIKTHLVGIEIESAVFAKLEKNYQFVKEKTSEIFNLQASVDLLQQDSKEYLKVLNPDNEYYLVANPPYGERIHEGGAEEILNQYLSHAEVKGAVIVHPLKWNFNKLHQNLKLSHQETFNNQGLKLNLSIFKADKKT